MARACLKKNKIRLASLRVLEAANVAKGIGVATMTAWTLTSAAVGRLVQIQEDKKGTLRFYN
jgi:hypothetical protein